MSASDVQVLAEMAVKLEATARKLPQGHGRDHLIRDIANFRSQLLAWSPRAGFNVTRSDEGKGK